MLSTTGTILEFMDLSGKHINLLYQKTDSVRTAMGGIITLIKFAFISFLLHAYVLPFYNRETINYYSYTLNELIRPNMTLDDDFLIAFNFYHNKSDTKLNPADYLNFSASYISEENFIISEESKKNK